MSAEDTIVSDETFLAEVQRLRAQDFELKDASNLLEGHTSIIMHASVFHGLYKRPSEAIRYVVVHDVPDTLSGNILRLRASLPWSPPPQDSLLSLDKLGAIRDDETQIRGYEIRGNDISEISGLSAIPLGLFIEDDDSEEENTADVVAKLSPADVAKLPLIVYDERIHFAKFPRLSSEIVNLLQAKEHKLLNVVDLLGRTDDGRIVFPKLNNHHKLSANTIGVLALKRIFLQLAEALIQLHSIGIIHRDLLPRNILGSSDHQTAYLCDLEVDLGSWECPEIAAALAVQREDLSLVPYSEASDVYMFGRLMTDFILSNATRTRWQGMDGGNWLPPAPFRSVVLDCVKAAPSARLTMCQVKDRLEAIPVPVTK
ncbi:kinase-like domain-containing protein [Mycena rosella]|uniref:Kinase-like domain-containing protein n=1 Tax=Mycena rosella TaxID=1033263 RepID=A0AAD7D425_MYCRO|nr:kinase-like domain-containing protein [Mycena rosella]